MNKTLIKKTFLILLLATGISWTGCIAESHSNKPAGETVLNNKLDTILKNLDNAAANLQSYECQIEYNFTQPLFDSQTLRKGNLYYQAAQKHSKLRINFDSVKQDNEEEQKQKEHFIFDGVWLTHINYTLKEVKKHQLTDPNEPADAFELVRRNFPIIGFGKNEDLKKEFEIELVKQEKELTTGIPADAGNHEFVHLHLKVKPDSAYKDNYTSIDFWIDEETHLPAKIIAVNLEEDVYEINLLKAKVNRKLDDKVFDIKIPQDFAKPVMTEVDNKK